jgi:hypothetical protein
LGSINFSLLSFLLFKRFVHTIRVRSRRKMKMMPPRHVLMIAARDRLIRSVTPVTDGDDVLIVVEPVEMTESVPEGATVDQRTPLGPSVCEMVLYSPKSIP